MRIEDLKHHSDGLTCFGFESIPLIPLFIYCQRKRSVATMHQSVSAPSQPLEILCRKAMVSKQLKRSCLYRISADLLQTRFHHGLHKNNYCNPCPGTKTTLNVSDKRRRMLTDDV